MMMRGEVVLLNDLRRKARRGSSPVIHLRLCVPAVDFDCIL